MEFQFDLISFVVGINVGMLAVALPHLLGYVAGMMFHRFSDRRNVPDMICPSSMSNKPILATVSADAMSSARGEMLARRA